MIVGLYVSNIAIAFWNFWRALAFLYRPNGDGWLHSIAYCFDCFCNALAGGDPRETISSRAGKAMLEGREWGCVLCKFLNLFQQNHCLKSIEKNEGARAVVPD